jgi:phage gp36-like protein
MPYATLDDLIARAGEAEILQVADRDDDGAADPDVVAGALDTADERINAWLAVRYAMPLSAVPPIVKGWAVSIARYVLHRDGAPDHVVKDYDDAVKELQSAAAGKLSLPGVDGVAPAPASGGGITSSCPDAVFTRKNLEGWL